MESGKTSRVARCERADGSESVTAPSLVRGTEDEDGSKSQIPAQ
jgi:hypothetical protein